MRLERDLLVCEYMCGGSVGRNVGGWGIVKIKEGCACVCVLVCVSL